MTGKRWKWDLNPQQAGSRVCFYPPVLLKHSTALFILLLGGICCIFMLALNCSLTGAGSLDESASVIITPGWVSCLAQIKRENAKTSGAFLPKNLGLVFPSRFLACSRYSWCLPTPVTLNPSRHTRLTSASHCILLSRGLHSGASICEWQELVDKHPSSLAPQLG